MTTEDIIEKIQKVLELAKRGGTEGEANAAMHKVLELLAKHNLDMSDVEHQEKPEDIIELSCEAGKPQWHTLIWGAISDLYFCRVFSRRYKRQEKWYKSFVLVGRKSNVDTAKSVIAYLIDLANELAVGDTLYRNSFKIGYAQRILMRCDEEKKKATNTNQIEFNSLAPAIINLYALTKKENEDFLAGLNLNLKKRKINPPAYDEKGFLNGWETGSKVSLKAAASGRLK